MTVRERIAQMLYDTPQHLVAVEDFMAATGTTPRSLRVHIYHIRRSWPHGGEIHAARSSRSVHGYRWVPACSEAGGASPADIAGRLTGVSSLFSPGARPGVFSGEDAA